MHSDHHALWINPKNSNEVWVGNDGGFYLSKDKGKIVQGDSRRGPRPVLRHLRRHEQAVLRLRRPAGQRQLGRPQRHPRPGGIRLSDWFNIGGGDGFHTQCDPTDPNTVYAESQYGSSGARQCRRARAARAAAAGGGERQRRRRQRQSGGINGQGSGPAHWNWSTPMLLSPHDPKTFYYGGNYLLSVHRTRRQLEEDQPRPDLRRRTAKTAAGRTPSSPSANRPRRRASSGPAPTMAASS